MTVLSPTGPHASSRDDAAETTLHDLDGLRRAAGAVRRHIVAELPDLLERFADHVLALGGHVCWAATAADARQYIARILARHDATQVLRSAPAPVPAAPPRFAAGAAARSVARPATEEIAVDQVIGACRAHVVETSLDAWIDRLADHAPGHLVTSAPHRERGRIRELLAEHACTEPSRHRRPSQLVDFARERLRDQFLGAEVGVGVAELAVAETGSVVVLTDQAHAHLATVLPQVHVVVVGIDQVAGRWDQADLLLALRHHTAPVTATAKLPTTTVLSGPRHLVDLDGPRELHVIVLDNGRSRRLAQRDDERPGDAIREAGPRGWT